MPWIWKALLFSLLAALGSASAAVVALAPAMALIGEPDWSIIGLFCWGMGVGGLVGTFAGMWIFDCPIKGEVNGQRSKAPGVAAQTGSVLPQPRRDTGRDVGNLS